MVMQIQKDSYLDEIIRNSGSIAVLAGNADNDTVASAVALSMFLNEKYGKKGVVVCKGDPKIIDPGISETYDILTDFEDKILKVIIDYSGSGIESVDHYKQEGQKLVLEIKPVKRDFDMNRIKYELEGGKYDTIVALGISNMEQFKNYYGNYNGTEDTVTIINIDSSHNNQNYGRINIVIPEAESLIALLMKKFSEWGYTPSKEVSKVMLMGLN